MNCTICGSNLTEPVFTSKILAKYDAGYFYCRECGLLQTESPFWLKEAYESALTLNDTGIISRNASLTAKTAPILYFLFGKNRAYLDWGAGYGLFVRMMRDIGFDFRWHDQYAQNLFARGFEYHLEKVELITCFEVFEHLPYPLVQIDEMLKITDTILFSTELYSEKNIPAKQRDWHYFAPEHGQHISFFSIRTLQYIASKKNLNFVSNNRNLHLFSRKPLKHKAILRFLLSAHRLILIPINEYVCRKMKSKTFTDSGLSGKTLE
jgi:hypothetical protein